MSNIYSRIYPSGSWPNKFYGNAKIHKISPNDSVEHLPIQPSVSNIGTNCSIFVKVFRVIIVTNNLSEPK